MTEIDRRSELGPSAAIGHYDQALARAPTNTRARLGRADALRESHRYAEARAAYDSLLRDQPDELAARLGRGLALIAEGEPASAARDLDSVLARDPDHATALRERALLDLAQGDAAKALERLDRVLALDPFDAEARYRRSRALARLGRQGESRAEQGHAARLRTEQAELRKIQRRFNEDPSNLELRCAIARWMFAHGQPSQGIRWARTVLEVDDRHPGANDLLAAHYRASGQPGLANYHRLRAHVEPPTGEP